MPEVLVVTAIMGTLAAIAIPITLSQRASAADMQVTSALTAAVAPIEAALVQWRGTPAEALYICYSTSDTALSSASGLDPWPSTNPVTNTCPAETWTAKTQAGGEPTPQLTGKVPETISIQGYVATDGSYCLDGRSSVSGSSPFFFSAQNGEPRPGTCLLAADGTGPWQRTNTATTITPAGDITPPDGPIDLAAVVTGQTVKLTWYADTGVSYFAQISNNNGKVTQALQSGEAVCFFPANLTCAGPPVGSLAPGVYTATVRAGTGAAGWGAPATVKFQINNGR